MPTFEEIQSEIENLPNGNRLKKERAVKALPNILHNNEHVENITLGMHGNRSGLLIATNSRVLFVDKGLVYGVNVDDFSYDKITSIQYKKGLLMGEIIIFTSGNSFGINHVVKQDAPDFCDYVRAKITEPPVAPAQNNNPSDDLTAKLERLAKLKEQGALSDQEFADAKKKLLE